MPSGRFSRCSVFPGGRTDQSDDYDPDGRGAEDTDRNPESHWVIPEGAICGKISGVRTLWPQRGGGVLGGLDRRESYCPRLSLVAYRNDVSDMSTTGADAV